MENLDVGSRSTFRGEAAVMGATYVLMVSPLSTFSSRAGLLSLPRAPSHVPVQPRVGGIVFRHFEGHLVEDGSVGPQGSKIALLGRAMVALDPTRGRRCPRLFLSQAETRFLGGKGGFCFSRNAAGSEEGACDARPLDARIR